MSDEPAERTFEQKRDEAKMVGVLITHEYRRLAPMPFDFRRQHASHGPVHVACDAQRRAVPGLAGHEHRLHYRG